MYFKYVTNFMTFVGLVVFFIGCSDNAATTTPTPAQPQQSTAFNSYEELTANAVCNESVNGVVAYTALENANFICTVDAATGVWIWALVQANVPQTEQPVQSGENNIQNCPYGILADGSCNNGMPLSASSQFSSTATTSDAPLILSSSAPNETKLLGSMTDSRDGQTYRTTTIGSQVWMAENLNYATTNSYCYNDIESNCIKYGHLYTFEAALGACPNGWHLPTLEEFETLITIAGGEMYAGIQLKSVGTWETDWGESDIYSFSVLPAGGGNGVSYRGEGTKAYFWTSTKYADLAYCITLPDESTSAYPEDGRCLVDNRYSVRCLKD
ncbi:major paralogous domain-containing protein [Fibrobacter intestinalis]|uniref:Major paralogous domain-containing protein n=1 Tax=Fibrobacter intestinalis TaxID=28122 RepID=A0A1M6ZP41_9BACT|nr:fibrobacter succinogenes major paralogous domain-containing protein [Fibrobacter intestinalis]SHL32105.1 major paralogous domain-containing protein [Fibrobacter intestinalis]